jgi:hypothetical protein
VGHTVSVDFVMPMEIAGVGSLACDPAVIPASKPPFDIIESARWLAKRVAVQETVKWIDHLLSVGWVWFTNTWFAHWVAAAIFWLLAWLLSLAGLFSHLLSEGWIWLTNTEFAHWVATAISWLFSNHN